MNLIYSDVVESKEAERELGITKVAFEDLLGAADFVTVHVPGGEGTHHLMSTDQFAMMKRTAFVINCSRGGVIDEKALAAALESGEIAGAALDVFEIEPGPSDTAFEDPIAGVRHVCGTHHIGASTEQAQLAVAEEVVRIVGRFVEHGDFTNCVNPAKVSSVS
jgi:phosphoglycerate dehydrogenase-like enzyme